MKVRIKNTPKPEMKQGGSVPVMPYAGINIINPFGDINSDTTSDESNINATVKPVDRDKANLEAEKGEMLFKFDMGGLFDIKGKRHSEGGTPLVADPGDFIFSRDKNLAFTKQEKDLFEFKEGGKYKKMDNTPAKVLKREVDPKHYNQLLSIMNDPKADPIAKKTAEIMLGKYTDKIGQVAYVQESKKGFPNGIPDFSNGTAPVQSSEFNDAEAQEQQHARMGGIMKAQQGGTPHLNYALPPSYIPPKLRNGLVKQNELADWQDNLLQNVNYLGDATPGNMQSFINQNYPNAVDYSYKNALLDLNNKQFDPNRINYDPNYVESQFNDGLYDTDRIKFRHLPFTSQQEFDDYTKTAKKIGNGNGTDYYYSGAGTPNTPVYDIPDLQIPQIVTTPPADNPPNNPGNPNPPINLRQPIPNRTNYVDNGIPWNAQEKLTTALPFLTALAMQSQYPMLQQIHTPDIRLDRISNASEVAEMRQNASTGQRELFQNMSGKTAGINAASIRAQLMNGIQQSAAGNENANRQINNQEAMTNYQSSINDRNFNVQALQKNYDETNSVLGRRQKELADAFAQSVNTGVGVQDKLDALKQGITQAGMVSADSNGQARYVLDPKTRTPVLNPNWHGDITNNSFLGANKDEIRENTQKIWQKAMAGDKNAADLLKIIFYGERTSKYGSALGNIYSR